MKCIGLTTKCIVCLKKAERYGGHLLLRKDYVLAGWCKDHDGEPKMNLMNRTGCYGGFHEKYGFQEEIE